MTEHEIKQNAEKCARLVLMPHQTLTDEYKGRYDGFIAGAHSRDEEIEELRKHDALENKMRIDLINECEQLKQELNKLCNPWISVKERLPETHEVKEGGRIFRTTDNLLLASKHGIHFGCIWLKDDGIYTFGTGADAIKTDLWTHWMPIPELKKGE